MTLKNFTWIFLLAFFTTPLSGQQYGWQWAKSATGNDDDGGNSITTDPSGNSIVAGYFFSASLTIGNFTLINSGNFDFFVAKYDPSGNVLWARAGGGLYDDIAQGVTSDASGNIFITGSFLSPTLTCGSLSAGNAGIGDIFVAKYSSSGTLLWLKSYGGSKNDGGGAICHDQYGNIFITGFFRSNSISFDTKQLINSGGNDVFFTRLNTNGIADWTSSLNGTMNDFGSGITCDASGSIYATGLFNSPVLHCTKDTVTNNGSEDIFVCKLDTSGQVQWLRQSGGAWNDSGSGITSGVNGNIYMTATFNSTLLTAGSITLSSSGGFDLMIAAYSPNGTLLWAKSEGGIFDETAYGIASDASGHVFFTGHTHSPSLILGQDTIFSSGVGDIYVAGYNSAGNIFMTQHVGGSADEGSSALACDASGNLFVTGYFMSSVLTCPEFTLTNSGGPELFIGKLNQKSIITSEEEFNLENSIGVFPNPANDHVTILSKTAINAIRIMDLNADLVFQKTDDRPEIQIELAGLSPGIYILEIHTHAVRFVKKLIIP